MGADARMIGNGGEWHSHPLYPFKSAANALEDRRLIQILKRNHHDD